METQYVGFGGASRTVATNMDLGRGSTRALPLHGIRRAVWDAAFGYVSGFRVRDILYYIATRSLSRHVERIVMQREGVLFVDGVATARRSN